MKKTILMCAAVASTALLLNACTFTHDSTTISKVDEVTLANGTVTKIGYTPAKPEWKCKQLDKTSSDRNMNEMKGLLKLGGGSQVLQEQAIDYANKHNLKPNYIFMYMPKETDIGSFDISSNTEAQATYYQCKITPALKTSIF